MQNGTNPEKTAKKIGILTGFITEVVTAQFMTMSDAELQHCIANKAKISNQLIAMLKVRNPYSEEKEQWRKFYQKHFSLNVDFSDVDVPTKPIDNSGDWVLLIIAQGLTLNQAYESMSKKLNYHKLYDENLDDFVAKNVRDTKTSYVIWTHAEVEPDKKYLGKSVNEADPDMSIGMTLLERMVLETKYFDGNSKYLDMKGITLCSGSRCFDGRVPGVDYYAGDNEVHISFYDSHASNALDGIREVIAN